MYPSFRALRILAGVAVLPRLVVIIPLIPQIATFSGQKTTTLLFIVVETTDLKIVRYKTDYTLIRVFSIQSKNTATIELLQQVLHRAMTGNFQPCVEFREWN